MLIATLTGQAIGLQLAEPTMSIIVNNSSGGSSDDLESGVVDVGGGDKGDIDVVITPPPGQGPGPGPGPGPVDESEDESEDESPPVTTTQPDDPCEYPDIQYVYDNYDPDFLECLCAFKEYC